MHRVLAKEYCFHNASECFYCSVVINFKYVTIPVVLASFISNYLASVIFR